ncbi:Gfo/Idh/MocA family protein [Falsiroseomonas sp. HW251]|uniref:Gfo/Idh/MocA family protein n=1 Tax=Falsiroseomonas sp. HW251 TaxID=3390998 RepID=UPI003D31B792
MTDAPGVAIVGCGLIGRKRAAALGAAHLVACADVQAARAEALAATAPGCRAFTDWRAALEAPGVAIVVIATLHDSLAEITRAAVVAGRHVLVEKPAARRASELRGIADDAARQGVQVRVGFNHRRHRAFRDAKRLVDDGALGPLMFIRARYGHGGRVGYDREWRADPALSGGGELIDQGPHIIDLARWMLGDFVQVDGFAATYFWHMPVDDNAFLLLRTADGKAAFLHASCTEWKNTFSFEIYGRDGKIEVNGLGGSYGLERMAFYRMLPEMGPPETTIREYPMADDSWAVEFADFLDDIRLGRRPDAGLAEAEAVLEIVGEIYRRSGYDRAA